jgi:hypothetical protein
MRLSQRKFPKVMKWASANAKDGGADGLFAECSVADEKSEPGKPHSPDYARAKAREMLTRADQADNEEDRQTFRALAEQWERMAKVAECPHL